MWLKADFSSAINQMSGFGDKADITRACADVRFWHKADMLTR
jgi:hypothetical protein